MMRCLIPSLLVIAACANPDETSEAASANLGGATVKVPGYVHLIDSQGEAYCGGLVIAPQVVLTAAHCAAMVEHPRDRQGATVQFNNGDKLGIADARSFDYIDYGEDELHFEQPDIGLIRLTHAISGLAFPHVAAENAASVEALATGHVVGGAIRTDRTVGRTLAVHVYRDHDTNTDLYYQGPQALEFGDSGSPLMSGATVIGVAAMRHRGKSYFARTATSYQNIAATVRIWGGWGR